jgi:hypothetical protein
VELEVEVVTDKTMTVEYVQWKVSEGEGGKTKGGNSRKELKFRKEKHVLLFLLQRVQFVSRDISLDIPCYCLLLWLMLLFLLEHLISPHHTEGNVEGY